MTKRTNHSERDTQRKVREVRDRNSPMLQSNSELRKVMGDGWVSFVRLRTRCWPARADDNGTNATAAQNPHYISVSVGMNLKIRSHEQCGATEKRNAWITQVKNDDGGRNRAQAAVRHRRVSFVLADDCLVAFQSGRLCYWYANVVPVWAHLV